MMLKTAMGAAALAFTALVAFGMVTQGAAGFEAVTDTLWGQVVLADLYLGFGLAIGIIGVVERSWQQALLWGLPLLALGNPVLALWLITRGLPRIGRPSGRRDLADG